MFRTPLSVLRHFSASGEAGLVSKFREAGSASGEDFEGTFAGAVAEFWDKDEHDAQTQALVDFLWGLWCGIYDEEICDLCREDMQKSPAGFPFLWHRSLKEIMKEMAVKYRVFVDACSAGPIATAPAGPILLGTSEFTDADKEDFEKVREMPMTLRRKSATFAALPAVGGASGADLTKAQLEKLRESLCL